MSTLDMVATEKLGSLQRSVKKELAHVNSVLFAGETVVNLATGDYRDRLGRGLLVLTDRRVLFVEASGMMATRMNVEDFALDRITSVSTQRGMASGTIEIHVSGNIAEIHKVMPLARTDEIASYVRERISSSPAAVAAPTAAPDILVQLKQLGDLRDAGILTPDEFEAKKADLLARL